MRITELFERGEFVISAEGGPPKGVSLDDLLDKSATYLPSGGRRNQRDRLSVFGHAPRVTCRLQGS